MGSAPAQPPNAGRRVAPRGWLVPAAFAALFGAAALAGFVAAAQPVSTAPDVGWLIVVALLLPVGGGLVARFDDVGRPLGALNAAVVAYVIALDLGYDGYYGDGTRFVDNGPVGPAALVALAGIAIATSVLAFRRPRDAAFAAALLMGFCFPLAFYLHAGH